MPAMSSRIDDRAGAARPRQVLVARAILGLTILAISVGITFAILDAQSGHGGVVFATGVLSDLPFLVAFGPSRSSATCSPHAALTTPSAGCSREWEPRSHWTPS
jgi:hypothetical protein